MRQQPLGVLELLHFKRIGLGFWRYYEIKNLTVNLRQHRKQITLEICRLCAASYQPDCSYRRGSWGYQKLRAVEEHRPGRAVKDSGSYFQPLTLSSCLCLGNVVAEFKLPPQKGSYSSNNFESITCRFVAGWAMPHDAEPTPCSQQGSCLTHPAENRERSTFPHQRSRETKCIRDCKAPGGYSDQSCNTRS